MDRSKTTEKRSGGLTKRRFRTAAKTLIDIQDRIDLGSCADIAVASNAKGPTFLSPTPALASARRIDHAGNLLKTRERR